MRIGYDSTTPSAMPRDGQVYGGYVDGHWPTFPTLSSLFPGKRYLSYTVNGTHDAMFADVEAGDFSIDGAVRWATDKVHRSGIAGLYISADPWANLRAAVHGAGLDGKVMYIVAHYDGQPVIPPGAVGKQYLGDYHGYDKCVFADHIPLLDPNPPKPPPEPAWFVRDLSYPVPSQHAGVVHRVRSVQGIVPMQVGRDVMVVQRKVGTTQDGMFGPGTEAAVKNYQGHHGLVADGVVGPKTAAKMGA